MADGYARVTGRHGVILTQNGPGVLNCVEGVAAAYWNHSPVVCITPEAGSMGKGLGGFQEVDQMPVFSSITKYQAHVNNPARMAEFTARAFDYAQLEKGPTQLNIPRDYFYGDSVHRVPAPSVPRRGPGSPVALAEAADLIANAKNPVILSGAGIAASGDHSSVVALAEHLQCPVACTYLHNDAFPCDHPLWTGPLGYLGHQTAMNSVHEADVIIALGTRLGPFGLLPQYGFDYMPKNAKIVQVDADARRLGLARPADVPINGDAHEAAQDLLSRLQGRELACSSNQDQRLARLAEHRTNWETLLDQMTYESEIPCPEGLVRPRVALRELENAMPDDAMVATDIGNLNSLSNGYLRFKNARSHLAAGPYGNCGYALPAVMGAKVGRPDRPAIAYAGDGAWGMSCTEIMTCVRENIPVTAVVLSNRQWGAEKKNQILWFGDRYVGTQLDVDGESMDFAEIARAMGAEGVRISDPALIGETLRSAVRDQMENGKTTVIQIDLSKELSDPFRRDAMKLPQRILPKYKHTDLDAESATGQPIDLV